MGKLKQQLIDQDVEPEPFPRGPGDPDAYGYPGEPQGEDDGPATTAGAQDQDAAF